MWKRKEIQEMLRPELIAVNQTTPQRRHFRTTPSAIAVILRRLERVFGPVEPPEQLPVLDELIATILSQNTTDSNSGAAFEELRRRFRDWEAVRRASVERVADAIRIAGLANQKTPRIKAVLQRLHEERGELSLEFLHEWPLDEACEYLRRFPGVGPKTIACVLLFACRKPILPVDTHVHRVSQRLGLIGPKTNEAKAHAELARLVPAERVLDFHIQLIRHGRQVCSARTPRCTDCVLLDRCPSGQETLTEDR
ncbi:MAG: endonuclease III [Planctomycetaceae bacterium]|nr:endonuclease III [Planctomycetaceae bacterium]